LLVHAEPRWDWSWLASTFALTREKVNRVTSVIEQEAAALDGLRVTLRTAGYDEQAISAATSASDVVGSPGLRSMVKYVQTDGDEPLHVLIRLFWIGAPVAGEVVERLVPELPLDGLVDAGVLYPEGDSVRSHLRVGDTFGLLVASDIDHERDDYVVSVSPSTTLASTHTPRAPARSALDVGCGQGLQALLAARHCDRVVATDFNARALWMTSLNARLNEIDNIETREGSFLEPVEGERFDLVVINPPYVISPTARFLYRDGGFEGDGLSRKLLADLPGHLEDGGFGALQGNWIHGADERWFAPIERGLSGSGCDAIMARISTSTPLEYAAGWNEPHHEGDSDGYGQVIREWLAHFEANGIERVSGAMVMLRRRPGTSNWRRAVSIARRPDSLGGEGLAALFDAQDRLAELNDDGLLDARLSAPEELRVERYQRRGQEPMCVLDLEAAIGVRRPVAPALAEVVLRLDGSAPLRTIDGAAGELDGVRALVKLGFVTFA
jgi:methylase of polypeptide subunit release factors